MPLIEETLRITTTAINRDRTTETIAKTLETTAVIDTTTTMAEETTTIETGVVAIETDVIIWEETEETIEGTTIIITIIEERMIEVDPGQIQDMVKVDSHSIQTHQIKWMDKLHSIRSSKIK